jgi:hypothetical protein
MCFIKITNDEYALENVCYRIKEFKIFGIVIYRIINSTTSKSALAELGDDSDNKYTVSGFKINKNENKSKRNN